MGLIHKCKACNYNTHVHASASVCTSAHVTYVCNGCGTVNDFLVNETPCRGCGHINKFPFYGKVYTCEACGLCQGLAKQIESCNPIEGEFTYPLIPPAAPLVNEKVPFNEEELEGASKQYQSYLERELSFAGLHDWVLDPKIMEHMLRRKQGFVIDRTLTWEGLPEKSYQLVIQPLVYGVG